MVCVQLWWSVKGVGNEISVNGEGEERLLPKHSCGYCSNNRVGDLNTSKAKLRGAKYQREKAKTGSFS